MKTFFTTIIILLFGLTSFAGVKSELLYELPPIQQHGIEVAKVPAAKLNTAEITKLAKKSATRTTDNWKSLGMGTFREFIMSSLYPGLFDPEDYQVEIQQNISDPDIYRVVNPYKNFDTSRYSCIDYDSTSNHDLIIHVETVSEIDYVWIEDFNTGLAIDEFGEIGVRSYIKHSLGQDVLKDIEWQNEMLPNSLGTYNNGLFEYPVAGFSSDWMGDRDYYGFNLLIYSDNYRKIVGYANQSASPFLVALPGYDVTQVKNPFDVYTYKGKGLFLNNLLSPLTKQQTIDPIEVDIYQDPNITESLHVRYAWNSVSSSATEEIDFPVFVSNPQNIDLCWFSNQLLGNSQDSIILIRSESTMFPDYDKNDKIKLDIEQKKIIFQKGSVHPFLLDDLRYFVNGKDEEFMFESYLTLPEEIIEDLLPKYDYGLKFSYNGRFMTITSTTPDASIEYCLDSIDNLWLPYNGSFDVGGVHQVLVKVQLPEYRSKIYTYVPMGYADENHVEVSPDFEEDSSNGIIESLYSWADIKIIKAIEKLRISGKINNLDYDWIKLNMTNLRHLDLSEVTDSVVPEGALKSERLLSVVMPEGVKKLGADVFGNGNRTLCAIEWPADRVAPANLLAGVENPNLLLYVNSLNYVSGLRVNDVNVVSGQRSRLVRLTDGMPFFAPKEFTADDISFTREFSKRTELEGGTAGWETIVLPFEVQTVAHSKGELMPFAKKDGTSGYGGLRYWLFGADVSGWVPAGKQEANVPYLIAMPNNEYYYDEYILGGEVTFSAKNAAVAVTPANIGSDLGTNRFVGTLSRVESSGTVMAVNDNAYEYSGEDFAPGSVFVAGLRDVRPFEAYLEAASGSKQAYMRIFDTSDVGELFAETGMRVWTENGEVCISSGISRKVMVCDMMGRVVRMAEVSAGEVCRVQGLAPGIYIVGDVKIRL